MSGAPIDVPPSPASAAPDLRVRALLVQLGVVLVALVVGGGAVGLLFREQLGHLGDRFTDLAGPWGVALAFFLPDATALPVPPDPFMYLALHGGMPFHVVVVAGSLGSLAGGSTAFLGAQLVRRFPPIHRRIEAKAGEVALVVRRYGILALALGALTPLPYSLMAWSCGVLGMSYRTFLLVSLLRIPRVALYAIAMWAFPMMWG